MCTADLFPDKPLPGLQEKFGDVTGWVWAQTERKPIPRIRVHPKPGLFPTESSRNTEVTKSAVKLLQAIPPCDGTNVPPKVSFCVRPIRETEMRFIEAPILRCGWKVLSSRHLVETSYRKLVIPTFRSGDTMREQIHSFRFFCPINAAMEDAEPSPTRVSRISPFKDMPTERSVTYPIETVRNWNSKNIVERNLDSLTKRFQPGGSWCEGGDA